MSYYGLSGLVFNTEMRKNCRFWCWVLLPCLPSWVPFDSALFGNCSAIFEIFVLVRLVWSEFGWISVFTLILFVERQEQH